MSEFKEVWRIAEMFASEVNLSLVSGVIFSNGEKVCTDLNSVSALEVAEAFYRMIDDKFVAYTLGEMRRRVVCSECSGHGEIACVIVCRACHGTGKVWEYKQ